jgi:hypothetical protein
VKCLGLCTVGFLLVSCSKVCGNLKYVITMVLVWMAYCTGEMRWWPDRLYYVNQVY